MIRRVLIPVALSLFVAHAAWSGDAATFVNLGFSVDQQTYMFAQYGIGVLSGRAYAELYTVDVPANEFVSDGVFRRTYDQDIQAGQDGSGALYRVLRKAAGMIDSHSIDHLQTGRPIYILMNDEEPKERIEFRDFESDRRYEVELHQEREGSGTDIRARFHLDVTIQRSDGSVHEERIGLPDHWRDGVESYRVRQALVSSDERSLVFVIEMHRPTERGKSIRYMVETTRLPG